MAQPKFSNPNSSTTPIIGEAYNKHCNTYDKRGHFSTCCSQKLVRAVSKNVPSDMSSDPDSFSDTDEKKTTLLVQFTKMKKYSQTLSPRIPTLTQPTHSLKMSGLLQLKQTEQSSRAQVNILSKADYQQVDTGAQVNILSKADYQQV